MLPVETIEALFPSSGVVGNIVLHPMTLSRATMMESLGVDVSAFVDLDRVLLAAWVLSLESDEIAVVMRSGNMAVLFRKWCDKFNPDVYELFPEVNRITATAFSTCVKGATEGEGDVVYTSGERGFGWTLELAEFMCHEYGMTMEHALATPISRVYGMICAARQRNGGKNAGPDYYERIEMQKAAEHFKKMKAEAEAREKDKSVEGSENG